MGTKDHWALLKWLDSSCVEELSEVVGGETWCFEASRIFVSAIVP